MPGKRMGYLCVPSAVFIMKAIDPEQYEIKGKFDDHN